MTIPKDKSVVLGLISTKRTELEPVAEVTRRIEEAARYFPRDQMGLSTQCGFGTVREGSPIAPSVQEEKLRLVVETAHRAWR